MGKHLPKSDDAFMRGDQAVLGAFVQDTLTFYFVGQVMFVWKLIVDQTDFVMLTIVGLCIPGILFGEIASLCVCTW